MPDTHQLGLSDLAVGIVDQTRRLSTLIRGSDLATDIPTCPGWNLVRLGRHVGGVQRWAQRAVRERATSPVFHDGVDGVSGDIDVSPGELADWLDSGAVELAAVLKKAGPDAAVWTIAPDGTPVFWARRALHDTVLHRADAAFATAGAFSIPAAIAVDGIDEWVASSTLPQAYESPRRYRDLVREGRAIGLRTTGDSPVRDWLIDLGSEPITWRHTEEQTTVTVTGSATDLLLLLYQRDDYATANIDGDVRLWWRFRYDAGDWLRR